MNDTSDEIWTSASKNFFSFFFSWRIDIVGAILVIDEHAKG
jgi:hypothetical protein